MFDSQVIQDAGHHEIDENLHPLRVVIEGRIGRQDGGPRAGYRVLVKSRSIAAIYWEDRAVHETRRIRA